MIIESENSQSESKNIARGTTDPEIDSVTWTKFGNNMAPLAFVANLTTRWRHLHKLQIWPPDGTCIATLLWIALLALSVSIDLVSSSARVTSPNQQNGSPLQQNGSQNQQVLNPLQQVGSSRIDKGGRANYMVNINQANWATSQASFGESISQKATGFSFRDMAQASIGGAVSKINSKCAMTALKLFNVWPTLVALRSRSHWWGVDAL